ncbi:hypothetical protein SAV31267_095050 [Streptomyces avermitilis]|uniref:Bacterial transcriptional activator domain-containing protein n=1 Tax=Streptomyces avermitilis TaxID=33903 RepID=A0A4D4N6J0_STRAX|nr:hypothetical protein SAV31267_095050 [Streptomyces avermitilis]
MSTADTFAPRLCLLGRFTLTYGPTTLDVGTAAQRLLAYLGMRHHGTRTVVAGTLWPDVPEERAHGSLRTALWRLHRGREPLVCSEGDTLALAESVTVDARTLMNSALHVVGTSPPAPAPPRDLLFAGDLLPGWDEDWVLFERERLRQLRLHALDSLAHRLLAEGTTPSLWRPHWRASGSNPCGRAPTELWSRYTWPSTMCWRRFGITGRSRTFSASNSVSPLLWASLRCFRPAR